MRWRERPVQAALRMNAASSSSLLLPSIGPRLHTASAPAALARRSVSSIGSPYNRPATNVPPAQSPAPVGSTSLTGKAGLATRRA